MRPAALPAVFHVTRQVRYAGVFLRTQSTGTHVFAVDTGNGKPDYIELPPRVEKIDVHGGTKQVEHPLKLPFQFGDKVNITIEDPA